MKTGRVLHLNDLASEGAGAETHLLSLQAWQRDQGLEVATFAAERVKARSRSLSTWWNVRAARRMSEVIAAFRPDVVHAHNVAHLSPSVLAAARSAGIPVHLTVHDFRHELSPFLPGQPIPGTSIHAWINRRKRRFVRGWIDRCCDVLITPSRALFDLTRQWARHARVLHCPYPMEIAKSTPPPPGAPFLFLGRLISDKGLRTLGQAMERTGSKVRLIVTGEGPLADEVARFQRTEYMGRCNRSEVKKLLQSCLALVNPSEWLENYPLSVLEAQSNARAVVATGVGGLPEMIHDGKNGRIVPPFDPQSLAEALTDLAENPRRAGLMGKLGQERVRRENNPDDVGRRILAMYAVGTTRTKPRGDLSGSPLYQ